MYAQIYGNLDRQQKALELLETLLDEEFEMIMARDTDGIGAIEFSIHELLRQIASERTNLKTSMHGTRLAEYADLIPEEDGAAVRRCLALIDASEQRCARLSSQNAELSLVILDQSHELMTFLHNQISPKPQLVYGRKGGFAQRRPEAALLNGRM